MSAPSKKVRCRYGPSPSGNLHIGSARTALFIYLFAKSQGGEFILRIDDTDLSRSNYGYTEEVIESLKWLGIRWDEGPIYQSHRFDIYKEHIQELLDTDRAYYEKTEKGSAVRFKMPEGLLEFEDLIHGAVRDDMSKYEDFVIQRSDGTPTYQIATVVDDHLMGITHLPRGNDLFKSTHRQNALYAALGWAPPLYAHIPLVAGDDAKKLSKRHGATSVLEFKNNLYLPGAMVNYLSMLGWAPKNRKEILSLEEMERYFDYRNISRTEVIFNISKLNWLNRQYLKNADIDDTAKALYELLVAKNVISPSYNFAKFRDVVRLLTPRYYSNCEEFIFNSRYFFDSSIEYDRSNIAVLENSTFKALEERFSRISQFTYSGIDTAIKDFCSQNGIAFAAVMQDIRYIITGKKVTPDMVSVILIIGKEGLLNRLRRFTASVCA